MTQISMKNKRNIVKTAAKLIGNDVKSIPTPEQTDMSNLGQDR